jgi:hypothetical protein
LFNKLNDYFAPANVVSRNGNPNMATFNSSDWIRMYPVKRTLLQNPLTLTSDNSFNASAIVAQLNVSNATNLTDFAFLFSNANNVCFNVPYKINVVFFYVKAGNVNGNTINNIVGSSVRYRTFFDFVNLQVF